MNNLNGSNHFELNMRPGIVILAGDATEGAEALLEAIGAPQWLRDSLDAAIESGDPRRSVLTGLAGRRLLSGCTPVEIENDLHAVNSGCCIPPMPAADVQAIARCIAEHEVSDLDRLNAMSVFEGRIEFASFNRQGPKIVATTTAGHTVVWPSTAALMNFRLSREIIFEATGIRLGGAR